MSVIENSKLAIIGAGGVGTALAYACLIRGSAREIALYDIQKEKVEAEVLDLAHGTQFTGSSQIVGGADLDVVSDANVVVITAGAKQKPGQTRLDLVKANVVILEKLLPQLLSRAADAVYILVTNPCDVLTVVAQQISGLPTERVFSSGTVLDSSRLRWLLGRKFQVDSGSVHAMIVGEHGDSQFPLWSQASIGPVPLSGYQYDGGRVMSTKDLLDIANDVRNAAYKVILGKGATNYAIGVSGARIVEAVLQDQNAVLPVSSVLENYKGISGVALSVPTVVNAKGIFKVLDVPMDVEETKKLHDSALALRSSL